MAREGEMCVDYSGYVAPGNDRAGKTRTNRKELPPGVRLKHWHLFLGIVTKQ